MYVIIKVLKDTDTDNLHAVLDLIGKELDELRTWFACIFGGRIYTPWEESWLSGRVGDSTVLVHTCKILNFTKGASTVVE